MAMRTIVLTALLTLWAAGASAACGPLTGPWRGFVENAGGLGWEIWACRIWILSDGRVSTNLSRSRCDHAIGEINVRYRLFGKVERVAGRDCIVKGAIRATAPSGARRWLRFENSQVVRDRVWTGTALESSAVGKITHAFVLQRTR